MFWSKHEIPNLFFKVLKFFQKKKEPDRINPNELFCKGPYRSNCVVPNSNFVKIFEIEKTGGLFIKLIESQYGSNSFEFDFYFINVSNKIFFMESLEQEQHRSHHIVLWSKFARKIGKCDADQKNKKIKNIKNHIKDNTGQIVLTLIQLKYIYCRTIKCLWWN